MANGKVEISTSGAVTQAAYACNANFTLSGSQMLQCQQDGTWSDEEPSCISCPMIGQLRNGHVKFLSNGSMSSVVFECDQGYSLNGAQYTHCASSGLWMDQMPLCGKIIKIILC